MPISRERLINHILDVKRSLFALLRNPVQEIKSVPDWSWPKLLLTHAAFTSLCGFLGGFLEENILRSSLGGIFIMPIITMIIAMLSSLFFYYCLQIFANKTVSFRQLYTIVLFANLPNFLFQIISPILPPATLLGLAFAALLIIVGFVENFSLNRKLTIKIILVPYILFFLIWIKARIENDLFVESWQKKHEVPKVHLGK